MILLVLVVLLWIAVLAPSAWRRFSERQGVGSIDHFHQQLQLLEHAGPKTVAPAYRLHTAVPAVGEAETPAPSVDTSRPKLVLLRPADAAGTADVADGNGSRYERVGVLDRPEPACVPEVGADLGSLRREQARHRCTMFLRCLGGVAISTALIGLFPGMHLIWILTGLTGLAALALIGLIAYAKELQTELDRRAATRRRLTATEPGAAEPGAAEWAGAGYPGAWDDDFELPHVAAR